MTVNGKLRLDEMLVDRGLAETRSRAHALIMAGRVYSGTRRLEKPGERVTADAALEIRGRDHDWVSRGALKLAHALDHFALDPAGRVCLDIGASTGGFSEVLLARKAATIYAVDVGHGQLAWKLRFDPRIVVLERTNARYLSREQIPLAPGFIVCDASFIGLETLLPASLALAGTNCVLVALIKPQFEVGKGETKRGVVRDPALHAAVCERISRWIGDRPGWRVLGVSESPVLGPAGNKEFLIAAVHDAG